MPALYRDQWALFYSGLKQFQGQETKAMDFGPDIESVLSAGCWYMWGEEEKEKWETAFALAEVFLQSSVTWCAGLFLSFFPFFKKLASFSNLSIYILGINSFAGEGCL